MNLFKVFINLFQFNRTNWRAVMLCFFAATVFWLFNAFNKTYSTNINFLLRFEYNQEQFAPIGTLPHHVKLNVKGNGWELFRKSMGLRQSEVVIPLERPTEVKKIVGSTLPVLLSNQLGSLQINHVVTDTLYLQLDERDTHQYKLYPDLSMVTFIEGYGRISAVVILPDSVEIEGPRKLLHQLPDSLFIPVSKSILDNSYREELEVTIPNGESLKRNPPVVTVMFEVGPVEVVERKVVIQVANIQSRARLSGLDSVTIVCQIPRNLRPDFESRAGEIQARVESKGKASGTFMLPEIVGLPEYAQLLSVDSIAIKF